MTIPTLFRLFTIVFVLSIPLWISPYRVTGSSMEPTLSPRDTIIVEKMSIMVAQPRRGERIVFTNPHNKNQINIKRVVGLPHETVHVRKDAVVITRACGEDSEPLEPARSEMQTLDGPCQITYKKGTLIGGRDENNGREFDMYLGSEDYFVLGDNRRDSYDSRLYGAVQKSDLIGRAVLRPWPLSRVGVLSNS